MIDTDSRLGSQTSFAYGFPLKSSEYGERITVRNRFYVYASKRESDCVPPTTRNHPDYPFTDDGSEPSAEALAAYELAVQAYDSCPEMLTEHDRRHYALCQWIMNDLKRIYGCTIREGGSEETPFFFVTALEPEVDPHASKDHGYSYKLVPGLTVGAEVDSNLREFCQRMGIEFQQPFWLLIESWS